jgi:hypothetical protein
MLAVDPDVRRLKAMFITTNANATKLIKRHPKEKK